VTVRDGARGEYDEGKRLVNHGLIVALGPQRRFDLRKRRPRVDLRKDLIGVFHRSPRLAGMDGDKWLDLNQLHVFSARTLRATGHI
jgi:hypothetical protein